MTKLTRADRYSVTYQGEAIFLNTHLPQLVHLHLRLTVNLTGQDCEIRQRTAETKPPLFDTTFFCWEQKLYFLKMLIGLERHV